jgi:hypothetical protein
VGPTAGLDPLETRKSLAVPGIESRVLDRQATSPVAIPTESQREARKRRIVHVVGGRHCIWMSVTRLAPFRF